MAVICVMLDYNVKHTDKNIPMTSPFKTNVDRISEELRPGKGMQLTDIIFY